MRRVNSQTIAFIASLVLHVFVVAMAYFAPSHAPLLSRNKTSAEVELVDPTELVKQLQKQHALAAPSTKGQVVEQDEHRINDELSKNARFLSRYNQTVTEETQAANRGDFKNSVTMGGTQSPQKSPGRDKQKKQKNEVAENSDSKQADKQEKTKRTETLNGNDVVVHQRSLRELTPSFKPSVPLPESDTVALGGGDAGSATNDHLKNVPTGMQTLLSTREFVYYSYYNRIKDKLRQYWEPKIKEKMERIMRQGRTIASTDDKITRIVILLDERGTLVRVQVVSPSGVTDLDEAAVEAFRAAAPFPNPPKGIIESDGMIRIRWDFVLEA